MPPPPATPAPRAASCFAKEAVRQGRPEPPPPPFQPHPSLRACLSVRFQGLTSPPEYRPSAPSRLRPAKRAALCLPDPCGLGSDSHDGKVFSGKLLKSLTQTGSKAPPNQRR